MRRSGYVVKRLAVAPQAVATIRRNALAQARDTARAGVAGLARPRGKNLPREASTGGGAAASCCWPIWRRTTTASATCSTKALAAVGRGAVAEAGLSEDALLVELSVLGGAPGSPALLARI